MPSVNYQFQDQLPNPIKLLTDIQCLRAFPGQTTPPSEKRSYRAFWDTGTTTTLVSSNLIQELNLKIAGAFDVKDLDGNVSQRPGYRLGLVFSETVFIPQVIVGQLPKDHPDFQILIGTDIMFQGVLSINGISGIPTMKFEMPNVTRVYLS